MSTELKKQLGRARLLGRCPVLPMHGQKRDQRLRSMIGQYAYNPSELCRAVNGLPPRQFRGCYYTSEEKDWWSAKGACKRIERGCENPQPTIDGTLRRMQDRGELQSVKLRWFDGRDTAQTGALQTDMFRYYFKNPKYLARRLRDDIDLFLTRKYGDLVELGDETYTPAQVADAWVRVCMTDMAANDWLAAINSCNEASERTGDDQYGRLAGDAMYMAREASPAEEEDFIDNWERTLDIVGNLGQLKYLQDKETGHKR